MVRSAAIRIQQRCDAVFGRFYYPLVCGILLLMVMFTARRGWAFSEAWDEWMVADWLISYAAGFVRRGLSGELILFASGLSGLRANLLVFVVLFSLFTFFCVLFARLIRNRQITFWYFCLCISPGFVLFTFYDPFALGRKEILLFVAFSAWATILARRTYPGRLGHAVFAIVCVFLTLMHELFLFFSFYFVLLAFLASRSADRNTRWRSSLLIPCCSLLAVLALNQFAVPFADPAECRRLIDLGAPASVCEGVLTYDAITTGDALGRFVGQFRPNTVVGLVGLFPLILLPLHLFLASNLSAREQPWRITGAVFALIVVSLPLFVLGRDWGRWISIHVVLLTITCAVLLPHKRPRPSDPLPGRTSWALIVGVCVSCSMFLWSLRHCCEYEYMNALGPLERLLP
jgi:hypothetical protein